jgi:hypothetical protein
MEDAQRVTELHPPPTNNGQSRDMEIKPDAEAAAQRRREALPFVDPIPVSRSSYLYEMDRRYRAAMTVKGSVELAGQSIDGLVYLDRKALGAAVERVSDRTQANIERIIEVVGHTTGLVVFDYGSANRG